MLDDPTVAIITKAFSDMQGTVTQVIGIAVPVTVGVICLSAGVNYALSKIRGVLGWA